VELNPDSQGNQYVRVPTAFDPSTARAQRWDGLAIASLILGIVPFVPIAGSVAAIVLGAVSCKREGATPKRGRILAVWGIWLGTVWFVVTLLYLMALVLLFVLMSQTIGKMD